MPDISRLAIIFTISSNKNATSNINKLINSFISSKRKRVRVPDVRVPDVFRTFSRLAINFAISSDRNANSNINKPINSFISRKRKRVRVPDIRVPDVFRTFPGSLSFFLLTLIGMIIAIVINLEIILLAFKGGKVRVPDISRLAIIFTISSNRNASSKINKLINSFISRKRKRVRVPDVCRTFSRLAIIFTINSNRNDTSNIHKPVNNSISIQRRKGPCAGHFPACYHFYY